jgi:hypothetical protein
VKLAFARFGTAALVALAILPSSDKLGAGEPVRPVSGERPPWQRLLQGDDARSARELVERILKSTAEARLEEALKAAEELAELRCKFQGPDHYEAVSARWYAVGVRRALEQAKDIQAKYCTVPVLEGRAGQLEVKADYRRAQPLRNEALSILRGTLGDDHPRTAKGYNNLALQRVFR